MNTIFLICAVFGSTILVVQMLLSLLGLLGGDAGMDFGGDDVDVDLSGDFGDADFGDGDFGDGDGDADFGDGDAGGSEAHDQSHHAGEVHGDNKLPWLAKVISFQTLVAFVAFFGFGGKIGQEYGLADVPTLLLALACGCCSMVLLAWLLAQLRSFEADGTFDVRQVIGRPARVYLRVPGGHAGAGKVTINAAGREVEMLAKTAGAVLPTGAQTLVSRVLDRRTVEVVAADSEQAHRLRRRLAETVAPDA